ncbi:DNA repair metallo-beta-lactamase domain-containing protein [Phthorimaea operculella]|nr:DNA repair metallo-beta-lactamase domain-containing protein [Phthorimaea operculella]
MQKLRSYLESLNGAFSEVVAFKPSGWENGKNSSVEKDTVTIHGIPYSEHSSFSELIRFVKFLQPKQVVPTVDISGGIKAWTRRRRRTRAKSQTTSAYNIHSMCPLSLEYKV